MERAFLWPATTILDKVEGGFISLDRDDQAIKVNSQHLIPQNNHKDCEC